MRAVKGIAAALILAALPWSAAQAHVGIGIGVNLGAPYYYGPYYNPYPYYYYNQYPVYAAPPTVVIQSAPVVQTAPAVRPSYSSPAEAVPAPTPLPSGITPQSVQPASLRQDAVREQMQLLNQADDRVRAEAAVELGRMKATRAVQPLMQTLAGDRSASVREAAARALGLIADTATLPALQHAAQADDDPNVRHSAQFAAEVIRSNMPH